MTTESPVFADAMREQTTKAAERKNAGILPRSTQELIAVSVVASHPEPVIHIARLNTSGVEDGTTSLK